VIPWSKVPLKECIETIRAGVSLTGENRPPQNGEVGILTLGAVSGGRFDAEACKAVPASAAAALREPVRGGKLLMSRSNTIDLVGSTVLVDEDHPNRFLPDLIWEITLREDSPLTARFLADFLSTPSGRALLQSAAMGTSGSMKKLSMARLRRLEVPAVPRPLQMSWEGLRESLTRIEEGCDTLLAAKHELKRGLMQELLTGRLRFPEFAGVPWRAMPLSEFFQEKNVRNRDEGLDLVLSCSKLYGIVPQSQRFKKRLASKSVVNYKVVAPGDLVYDPMLLWDASIGFVPEPYNGVVSPAYATFEFRGEHACRSFFAQALFTHSLRHQYRVVSRGTNVRRKKAMPGDFLRIKIAVPPTYEEQRRIGSLFAVLDREIARLDAQRDQFELQKRALMQKLLSGEVEIHAKERDG
jgi:type I restriction enzyme S subunit